MNSRSGREKGDWNERGRVRALFSHSQLESTVSRVDEVVLSLQLLSHAGEYESQAQQASGGGNRNRRSGDESGEEIVRNDSARAPLWPRVPVFPPWHIFFIFNNNNKHKISHDILKCIENQHSFTCRISNIGCTVLSADRPSTIAVARFGPRGKPI